MKDLLGSIPQWITAIVACGGAWFAYSSIQNQREIARKRAAMDFFAKTEMDKHTLDQHKAFKNAAKQFAKIKDDEEKLASFQESTDYWAIRDYLNLHELMAVGIKRGVFDDYVCYDFWAGEFDRAIVDTRPLISYIQKLEGEEETYCELLKVHDRWEKSGPSPIPTT
jgi:hypothetical protein